MMKPFYDELGSTLINGDCIPVMASMRKDSIDTIITDPPYHLTTGKAGGTGTASLNPDSPAGRSRIGTGFMGKAWDGGDVAFRVETWQAALRVAKPGAFLLAFGGTRTFHRLTCAIEDAGWEIRDCMSWLYGSGFPKSLDISKAIDKAAGVKLESRGHFQFTAADKGTTPGAFRTNEERQNPGCRKALPTTAIATQWNGWGTALKPAWEPIIVAMKPLDGTFAQNGQRHGVAGLNIDGGRIEAEAGWQEWVKKTARPNTQGEDMGNYIYNGGWKATTNPSDKGRWPANVLLDGEAAQQLDEATGTLTSGEPAGIKTGGQGNAFGHFNGGIPVTGYGDSGGASRFFYTAKASRSDRGHGNDHPTVKPTDLLKYLCKLTATPTGGVILDPFAGSGTTLVAAREYGRPCIGIELEEAHCRIVVERLRQGVLWPPPGGGQPRTPSA